MPDLFTRIRPLSRNPIEQQERGSPCGSSSSCSPCPGRSRAAFERPGHENLGRQEGRAQETVPIPR